MDDHDVEPDDQPTDEANRRRARRRRSLDDVFGEILPKTTRDETRGADGPGRSDADVERDDEIRRDVPPHHG